jgi:hypothetical protein
MTTEPVGSNARQPTAKIGATRKRVSKRTRSSARTDSARTDTAPAKPGSVIMQARVDEGFARTLVEQDAVVLGLDGPSALVREGLRLVHERAREAAMIAAYDDFYAGEPAPLPTGVIPSGVEQ